jgi:hypothetical protein
MLFNNLSSNRLGRVRGGHNNCGLMSIIIGMYGPPQDCKRKTGMGCVVCTNVFGLCQIFTPPETGSIADGRNQSRGCSRSRTPVPFVCDHHWNVRAESAQPPDMLASSSPGLQ